MSDHLVVFAREPVAGTTKTRLADGIGAGAAARIAAVLLDHTLQVAAEVGCPVTVSLADPPSSEFAARLGVHWEVQDGADLGRRMADAFGRRFDDGAERVVLVGSDCPGIHLRHLQAAFAALDTVDVVLGPAEDGGYWCVGQCAPGVDLFEDVRFSERSTMRRTRQRLRAIGTGWAEVATLGDVDTPADLESALESSRIDPRLAGRLRAALDD